MTADLKYSDADAIQRRRELQIKGGAEPSEKEMMGDKGHGGDIQSTGSAANKRAAAKATDGSTKTTQGVDAASSGMMMSGNAYAAAAGAVLRTGSEIYKSGRRADEANAARRQRRLENQQVALSKLVDMSNGLRRL